MSDYWSETGKMLGSLIEQPKMDEKLLKRPPPKYIYDIVLNTMKKTNFPKGLLTEEEMEQKYWKADHRHKFDILKKIVDITRIVMNEYFEIKVTDILTGKEPEKTNYFLRMFYKAATNGKDNTPLIKKYLKLLENKKIEEKIKEKTMLICKEDINNINEKTKNDENKIAGDYEIKMDKKHFIQENLINSNNSKNEAQENKINEFSNLTEIKSIKTLKNKNNKTPIAVMFFIPEQNIHFAISCFLSDKFSIIEEKLFDEFHELKSKQIYYLANGKIVDKNATIEQNNIKNSTTILINYFE